MERRLSGPAKVVGWIVAAVVAWVVCAACVLTAAVLTRGTSDTPVRGLAGTPIEAGWEVTNFNAHYVVDTHGKLTVDEQIAVDFHGLQKHGIYRNLFWRVDCQPPRTSIEASLSPCPAGKLRTYGINVDSVTASDGHPLQYTVSRLGDSDQIKIGDPNSLVSGTQTYDIRYTVAGALDAYANHDDLYWNASGTWGVPVQAFSATVTLPRGPISDVSCFAGTPQATTACQSNQSSANVASFASAALDRGQQVTLETSFPAGTVSVAKPRIWTPPNYRAFYRLDVFDIGGAVLVGLLCAAALGWLWWKHGRDEEYRTIYYLTQDPSERRRPLFGHQPVVVEFTPPDGLKPAEMGMLLDERADTLDVTATVVDLAVRGYIKIEELAPADSPSKKKDWRLVRMQKSSGDDLLPYERTLLLSLFPEHGRVTTVLVSDLKTHFEDSLLAVEDKLYKDAAAKKWFMQDPRVARSAPAGVATLIVIAGLALCYFAGLEWGLALVPSAVPVAGVALLPLAETMSRRTATGSEALRRVLGFRLYIETAETRRQEFNEKANIFVAYLPYAIVFGSVTKWAKAFSGLDDQVRQSLDWYSGGDMATAFSVGEFSLALRGMSGGIGNAFAAPAVIPMDTTPGGGIGTSSGWGGGFGGFGGGGFGGGFGGGGFAGGGGGGGGGGSW